MIFIILFVLSLFALYFYTTRNFKYWEKKGVKYDKPLPIFGNYLQVYLLRKSVIQTLTDCYRRYPKEKVVGFFRSSTPELIIRDPEIIKRILVTDFSNFYARGFNHKEVVEPLMRNMVFADGDLWRLLRQRTTPAFTSGKLKAMFPLVVERAERLQARTLTAAREHGIVDACELMACFTTDFIGACGFGLDTNSLEKDSAFRRLGAKIFRYGVKDIIVALLKETFPDTFKHLKYYSKVEAEFIKFVNDIIKYRNNRFSGRNDFIDLMLECKSKGTIVVESIEHVNADGTPERVSLEFDDTMIAAQAFAFFAAGFETSSTATSFTLHQLAFHPEIQEKVQREIDTVLRKHDNKLSYEAIKEMTYLEWTFKEALRMFPPFSFLTRKSAQKYTFPNLELTIDKDMLVIIPVQALHNDPQYFEQPHEFRPERFHPDTFNDCHKNVYLPFGNGQRACTGERLGLMQSLAGLAAVLSRCSVRPGPTSLRNPRVALVSMVQTIKDGLPLLFLERSTSLNDKSSSTSVL